MPFTVLHYVNKDIIYKALHTSAPSYQCELLNWYQPPRPLRSATTTSLVANKNKTVRYGRRLLDPSEATLWNILPPQLKCAKSVACFKGQIKTYFFND